MAHSDFECKITINKWLNDFRDSIGSVLDIGAGSGTYYNLYYQTYRKLRHAQWTAVEIWQPYIEEYQLASKYDKVFSEDIRNFNFRQLGKIDLVFAGDVLEHMEKTEAIAVINQCSDIANRIIISIPIVHYPQEPINNNPYEAHVKDDWSHEEVMETFDNIVKFEKGKLTGAYLIHTNT